MVAAAANAPSKKQSGSPGRRLAEGPTRQAETGSQSNESKPEAANTKEKENHACCKCDG